MPVEPISHVATWSTVFALGLTTAVFGAIDDNWVMMTIGVVTAFAVAAINIYKQVRQARREQDIADEKARIELDQMRAMQAETAKLRDQVTRLSSSQGGDKE